MTEMSPTPRAMKKAMDRRRPATTISSLYLFAKIWVWLTGARLRGFFFRQRRVGLDHADRLGDPEVLQDTDQNPGRIEFVPGEAMARGGRMRVVIVVPALAETQERYPPEVA